MVTFQPRSNSLLGCLLGLCAAAATFLTPAGQAETVVERAARTGVIKFGGPTDLIPSSYVDDQQQLVGFSIDVADRITAEISRIIGKPVKVLYEPEQDISRLIERVQRGEVDMACGMQFTWEREMFSDFTIPYSLSGIRLLTREGGIDGSAESLRGRRIGVMPDSLGDRTVQQLQPQANRVPFNAVDDGIQALLAGRVDALAGDSLVLGGTIQRHARSGYRLVPEKAFTRYAVGCMMPENNPTARNLANLAIGSLLQGYLNNEPASTELVGKWVGPNGIVKVPIDMIRAYYEMVLITHEQIQTPSASTTSN
ncbi:transporter substrate-binding domain-containing protein [Synechococcus sp. BSF8S]|uniref:extracellular substrate binding-like orphan protein GrrP n=1 Tax=Cyanobium sp. BSA11S TaxID=3108224 RepID=UPI00162617C9|nr:extracellular substrate binding-like orphan protein GrrP [Synechococcus sp. BSF8S]MBC1262251.1 transporter substrate-binding domain-containing protein [Synechococcus sp. BSF8S]